ncbi:MAG: TetR/AcrR family transcriptional regulator [Hydrogenophaga sp.]|nr:TetR/AcrR family transcriptional regulator [Hydrogenophaga sp.]
MAKELVRQGGRSARIQTAVHQAVEALLEKHERTELTVPMIAEQAGVTPSTVYRRWGDLSDLLADVAVRRMRPIADPEDTGALSSDLETWALQFMEEMSSRVGREMLGDIFATSGEGVYPLRCCNYTYDQIGVLRARAIDRREASFEVGEVIDRVVAPIVYHILFGDRELTDDYCRELVAGLPFLSKTA